MKKGIANSFIYILVYCIPMLVTIGCGALGQREATMGDTVDAMNSAEELSENSLMTEEKAFRVTDSRSYETVYYECASDFIADCGFKEEELFWKYRTEEGSLQLVLYYDEASKEGCGVRYYPEEENTPEEGFRFSGGFPEEPQYSVMEAWVDLASGSTLSYRRSTGKTAVSEYEESKECFSDWPYDMQHFTSKGIIKSSEDINPASLIEIDWQYREDGTLQKKEYRHNTQVFGTYRGSADYYYGEDERLLYQNFYITHGSGEVYYIYGEDEIVPEYYLHLDQNHGLLAELVSYDTKIPEEDKLNLDEERILEQVSTADWIVVNPDTGIGIDFGGKIVDIIQEEEKILYYRFLNGQIGAVMHGDTGVEKIPASYYEYGPLNYAYVDLNDDDIQELLIYPGEIFMQILTIDQNQVYWVSTPFYSGATGEIINANKEIVMVDENHMRRRQYSVYRLNDEKELEDIIFFQVWFKGESTGLEKDEYTKYIGGMENGAEEVITKEEFDALYEKYVQNEFEVEWKEFAPHEEELEIN